jgi:cysteine desulfurase
MTYLDHNATTPPAPEVVAALLATLAQHWANASSQHGPGQQAKRVLGTARADVARALGCKPNEVVFTSGATEANHLALRGLMAAASAPDAFPHAPQPPRLLVSAVEHAGLLRQANAMAHEGTAVDVIPVRPDGALDLVSARALLSPGSTAQGRVAVVSVQAANNETGVLMPVAELAALAHEAGALLHVDATQWVGKLPFDFSAPPFAGVHAVSLSAHKFHGPKGVGALLLRSGTPLTPQVPGSQERGRRGGTENLPAIVGMAQALALLGTPPTLTERIRHTTALRDALEHGLAQALPGVHVWGQTLPRLPGTSFLRFGHLHADVVLQRLDRLGVAASSGAACSSGGSAPSHVLAAMGVPPEQALCAVRLSLGHTHTLDDVNHVVRGLTEMLGPLLAP